MKLNTNVFEIPKITDARGALSVLNFSNLNIKPQRIFWVRGVPTDVVRGKHFHKLCNQLLICTKGEVIISITPPIGTYGTQSLTINQAMYLPSNHFVEYQFKNIDSELLVLADQEFDLNDVFTSDDWIDENQ